MNLKIFITIFMGLAASIVLVKSAPLSLEEYFYDELARNIRSDKINSVEWPQQNEIRDEEYAPHDDLNTIFKNELNKFKKKKLIPLDMINKRLNNRERIDKRNSPSNSNYYIQLCHFKICNIRGGMKRRSRYLQEQDLSLKKLSKMYLPPSVLNDLFYELFRDTNNDFLFDYDDDLQDEEDVYNETDPIDEEDVYNETDPIDNTDDDYSSDSNDADEIDIDFLLDLNDIEEDLIYYLDLVDANNLEDDESYIDNIID
ncbi:hypothetical protein PVAND_000161 [Polypedilum vanderplanki]|uniref:Uncharacterized protein n=1 Tax=Polypedilum vanderplanki TaxID=319348 RepID=A0A9J6BKG9_POLVA|nr:hypothetical protein PVAND_000161 [Polypedilum vanderplanki]